MSTPRTEVVVLDLVAGRVLGHGDHYLNSLETAIGDCSPVVWAPYRNRGSRGGVLSLWHQLALGWRAFNPPPRVERVVLVHTPGPLEKLLLMLAALTRRRAIGVYVLRRSGDDLNARSHPLVAAGSRITAIVMAQLMRRGWLYPVSDSRLALEHWQALAGVTHGTTVALPPPPLADQPLPPRSGGPVVALPGCFRLERGAHHYDMVIESALREIEGVTVDVQLSEQNDDGSAPFADAIRERWRSDPQVRLHEGYLSDEEYGGLLAGADVVVLPYDAESYTTGTSGVLHEALVLGATVLTVPLAWAAADHGDNPRLRFVEGWDAETVRRELPELVRAAVRSRETIEVSNPDRFSESWHEALEQASQRLRARRSRRQS